MKRIILSECGILPNKNITLALYKLFCEHKEDTIFVFQKGDYYFSPFEEMKFEYRLSNSAELPKRILGIYMKGMRNCVIEGNDARFWFEGHMQPLTLDKCQNIIAKDFTINWKKPMVAEGLVCAVSDEFADVYISSGKFPYRMNKGQIEFDIGANEWYPMGKHNVIVYEPHYRTVRRATGDYYISEVVPLAEDNTFRFRFSAATDICAGDLLVLRHNERYHAGIFTEKCKDVLFEDIIFHSCGGLGCLSQFCENMTYRKVHFIPDRSRGRVITSGRDDGMHITCNKGTITITECTFLGLMDDPINVHGCSVVVDECVDSHTLRCHYGHEEANNFLYWAEKNDEIAFIDRKTMHRLGVAKVDQYKLENKTTFLLSFSETIPDDIFELAKIDGKLALENLTNTAELVCTKNRFGSCRARGILASTPQKVLIEDNYFESSGAAILIPGDAKYWFESGECNDVTIKHNVFTSACLTSYYQFCEGIISICPMIPEPKLDKPFHKNIVIADNTFDVAETPILYAFSCANLKFTNNKIFKSHSADKWHNSNWRIKLSYCADVAIENNSWIGNFLSPLIIEETSENVINKDFI